MLVLGIDTSTDVLSLSLADRSALRGTVKLGSHTKVPDRRPREHSEQLMPALDELLRLCGCKPSDLEGIAVVHGPGGFTGIRTGLTVAKTVSQALGLPIVGIPSLELLVRSYPGTGLLSPMLDARRGEVFAALYRKTEEGVEVLMKEGLWHLSEWLEAIRHYEEPISFIGEGAVRYESEIRAENRTPIPFSDGSYAAVLGEAWLLEGRQDNALSLLPAYLRLPSMVVKQQQKDARP